MFSMQTFYTHICALEQGQLQVSVESKTLRLRIQYRTLPLGQLRAFQNQKVSWSQGWAIASVLVLIMTSKSW